jgi:hypothetical protein
VAARLLCPRNHKVKPGVLEPLDDFRQLWPIRLDNLELRKVGVEPTFPVEINQVSSPLDDPPSQGLTLGLVDGAGFEPASPDGLYKAF